MPFRLTMLMLAAWLPWLAGPLRGQALTLPQAEAQLAGYARDILQHPDIEHRFAQNKRFTELLRQTLARPESAGYPFDSLGSISILRPQDRSFRIFTWHIADRDVEERGGAELFYYFGLIQRNITRQPALPGQPRELIVIPLIEMREVPKGIENVALSNERWFGAQYYPPKFQDGLQGIRMTYYARPTSSQAAPRRITNTFYVLLGWNGGDGDADYKLVDVLSFAPDQPEKAVFGADMFYFDNIIPKFRAVFKYSQNAPFTLNTAYVQAGFRKRKVLVYDHLSRPDRNKAAPTGTWEIGPDGSYDALRFVPKVKSARSTKTGLAVQQRRSKGYFQWERNVRLATAYNNRQNQAEIERRRAEALAKDIGEANARKAAQAMRTETRSDKAAQKALREQQAAEAARLREAGIKLKGMQKPGADGNP